MAATRSTKKPKTTKQTSLEKEAEGLEKIIYKGLLKLDRLQEEIDALEAARNRDR